MVSLVCSVSADAILPSRKPGAQAVILAARCFLPFPSGTEGGKEGEGFGERKTGDAGSLSP